VVEHKEREFRDAIVEEIQLLCEDLWERSDEAIAKFAEAHGVWKVNHGNDDYDVFLTKLGLDGNSLELALEEIFQSGSDLEAAWHNSEQMNLAWRKHRGQADDLTDEPPISDIFVPAHVFDTDVEAMKLAITRHEKPISVMEAANLTILEDMVLTASTDEVAALPQMTANCWRYAKNRALEIMGAVSKKEKRHLEANILEKHRVRRGQLGLAIENAKPVLSAE